MSISKQNGYDRLTENSALSLANQLKLFGEGVVLACHQISGWNVSLLFRVFDVKSSKGILIKQVLPNEKVLEDGCPPILNRAALESNVYGSYVPEYVPNVYYVDTSKGITIIEDLSDFQSVQFGLIQGDNFPILSEQIGTCLAKVLFYTADFPLAAHLKENRLKQCNKLEFNEISENDLFFNHENTNIEKESNQYARELRDNSHLKREIEKLKNKLLTKDEALIHGDLHTGNILVSKTETKVVAPESSFFGPSGFDIGTFFGSLLLTAISADEQAKETAFNHISNTWDVFSKTYRGLSEKEQNEAANLEFVLKQILQDSIGFAGCEVIRQTIESEQGATHTERMKRLSDNRLALSFGKELILNHETITDIKEIKEFFKITIW